MKQRILLEKKRIKRKIFFLKVKFFFVCVLPVVIVLLAAKVIETLVRTKIKKAAIQAKEKTEEDI